MIKILLIALGACSLAVAQQSPDYFYDYVDIPQQFQQEQVAARPPPPQPTRARAPQPSRSRPAARPVAQQSSRQDPLDNGPTTTPIPILIDSRTIDTKTGAFVYQYAGADGSTKYEVRLQNGTVVGNYSFIDGNGDRQTRWYNAGVVDPNAVDETTDPNYVDLSNYDLYRHLEEPYVDEFASQQTVRQERPSAPRESRPRVQQTRTEPSRPQAQRPAASRPTAQRQAASRPRPQRPAPQPAVATFQQQPTASPLPLDFGDAEAQFAQGPVSGQAFDYEDIPITVSERRPAPPPPQPRPQQSSSSRGRFSSGAKPLPAPNHRFQDPSSVLDALIAEFSQS